jgi:nitroreductase
MTDDFFNLVLKRNSIRNFSCQPVPRELLLKCLEAARLAPSACNAQPWYFLVFDESPFKEKVADLAFSGIYATNSFAREAPVLIAVIRRQILSPAKAAGWWQQTDFSLMDLGMACEHLVLQATAFGLGSCYLGWFNKKALKKIIPRPFNGRIELLIALGYPEGENLKNKIRKNLNEISNF